MIKLPYGKTAINFDSSIFDNIKVIQPLKITPASDPAGVVENAINNPVSEINVSKISTIKTVAIAINDKTRPVPHQFLIPPLLNFLIRSGVQQENIVFFIATGSHTPMRSDEFQRVLSKDIFEQYRVVSHDCDDAKNLEFLGTTNRGTPVYVNQQYFQSELKIVIGNIEPHHFMGFSGGVKSASIGLTGRQTINRNHAMLIDPLAIAGEYTRNPMRQDIEEIGEMIGVDLALNAVLNSDKQIVEAFWGTPKEVMRQGIIASKKICQSGINEKFDLVIASAGGHPKDINLYQSQKAITHAALFAKDHGVVIICAACPEMAGSDSFVDFVDGLETLDDVFQKFEKQGFQVGPHKAFQIALQAKRLKIILVSDMPAAMVNRFFITPASTLEEAISIAKINVPNRPNVVILPYATNTLP